MLAKPHTQVGLWWPGRRFWLSRAVELNDPHIQQPAQQFGNYVFICFYQFLVGNFGKTLGQAWLNSKHIITIVACDFHGRTLQSSIWSQGQRTCCDPDDSMCARWFSYCHQTLFAIIIPATYTFWGLFVELVSSYSPLSITRVSKAVVQVLMRDLVLQPKRVRHVKFKKSPLVIIFFCK